MTNFTKDQLLHLDLPKEFRGDFQSKPSMSDIPWDFILLGITILFLFYDNN